MYIYCMCVCVMTGGFCKMDFFDHFLNLKCQIKLIFVFNKVVRDF